MPNKHIKKALYVFLAIAFWFIVWEAASFLISDNLKLFLPSPIAVLRALSRLVTMLSFWHSVILTLLRIFLGFICGVTAGVIFGILTSSFKLSDIIISPAMRVVRAVPVVSFIILAYLFISVNYLPVFICFLMVMPLIWQTVHDEITNFDKDLTEMAKVFKIGGLKNLCFIKLTTISDEIISSMINGIGLAWKSGVASEVLCAPAISIGRNLYRAKGNISYDEVYAITLTIVILSIIIETLIKFSYRKKRKAEENNDKV